MYFKYPRTFHLPFSRTVTEDDKRLTDTFHFDGMEVVVTEKMDGENTSLYRDRYHARSLNQNSHPSRDWVKGLHSRISHEIPIGWRVCGENLFARHSIEYADLESFFLAFSVWNQSNVCLSWDDTVEWCSLLGIAMVKVLYRGNYDEKKIKGIASSLDTTKSEGLVVRLADEFHYEDFSRSVAKWVREGHVTTNEHWMFNKIVPNKLKWMDLGHEN
jgi:hypothetical protein